jgi:hypothetical protein
MTTKKPQAQCSAASYEFFYCKLGGLSREHQQIREFAGLQLEHFFLWHFDIAPGCASELSRALGLIG